MSAVRQQGWPVQAFQLSSELIDSISEEEVDASWSDMQELSLARDPFDEYDIIVPEWKCVSVVGPDGKVSEAQVAANKSRGYLVRMRFIAGQAPLFLMQNHAKQFKEMEQILDWTYKTAPPSKWEIEAEPVMTDKDKWLEKYQQECQLVMGNYRRALIVLLATKNVVKEVKECKTLKLGIGSKERNRYTTTLKIGQVSETASSDRQSESTGIARRPHLRRGHIRRQHFGPANELVKTIWIEPVFVNADASWISERTAYNVSLAAKPLASATGTILSKAS